MSTAKRLTLPVLGPLTSSAGGHSASPSNFANLDPGYQITSTDMSTAVTAPLPTALPMASPVNDRRQHVLRQEELRKVSDGKLIKTSKKWFVLYDDNLNPLSGGGGGSNAGSFEPSGLRSRSYDSGVHHVPAHLEYHDSEKKWRDGKPPNRDIVLKDCFNIYKKKDKEGLNGLTISVCTLKDSLDIVFENEQDLLIWLELLLSCQQGGRSAKGRIPRPIYEHMWEVNVKGFKPREESKDRVKDVKASSKFPKFHMSGPYRLAVTHDTVKFFEVGSLESKNFPITVLSGHNEGKRGCLKLGTGWFSIAGRGEIEMDVKDQAVAEVIIAAIFPTTRGLSAGAKSGHHRLQSTSSSRSSKSRDSMHDVPVSINASSSSKAITTSSYRPRSESWSNPTVSHSLTNSGAKGMLLSHPATSTKSHPTRMGHKDARHRTSSEGNHFDLICKGRKGQKSIMSSSPMSPGSCMSSESAGSSNSIDDNDVPFDVHRYGSSITPSTDHPPAATIIEESSGESWVDPVTVQEQLDASSGKVGHLPLEAEKGISYAQLDGLDVPEGKLAAEDLLASSPTRIQYSTIIDPTTLAAAGAPSETSDDYMMMSPPSAMTFGKSAAPAVASGSSSSTSSLKRKATTGAARNTLERERRRLSMLTLDSGNMASSINSTITSPSSQSSNNNEEYTLMSPSSDSGFVLANHKRTASSLSSCCKDEDDAYVDMGPGKIKTVSSSPSAALTSHLSGPLLYTDPSTTATISSSETDPYLVMSPVNVTDSKSILSRLMGSEDRLLPAAAAAASAGPERASHCPEEAHNTVIQDEIYMQMDFGAQNDTLPPQDHGIPIHPAARRGTGRLSPSSSCSAVSGTPNSCTGSSDFLHHRLPSLTDGGGGAEEAVDAKSRSKWSSRTHSLTSKPPPSSSSSSLASSTNGGAAAAGAFKSRNIDIPASSSSSGADKFPAASPNTVASRLGSWFRHRAGSVPARPVLSGRRRHRTQSEGEKDTARPESSQDAGKAS